MAKYSPVGPIAWLEQLQDANMLGDYLLLLAHEVLEEPQRYRNLMKRVRDSHADSFIILDNSVIELGAALPANHMKEACDIVQPSCIVLPDVMGDAQQTIAASAYGAVKYRNGGISAPFLAVIHGRNIPELAWCCQQLQVNINPRYWGLPRIVANTVGTRMVFENILGLNYPQLKPNVHLLGMSQDIEDDLRCCQYPGILGIDSANPLILGQAGHLLDTHNYKHMSRQGLWGAQPLLATTLENIERMRDVAQTGI